MRQKAALGLIIVGIEECDHVLKRHQRKFRLVTQIGRRFSHKVLQQRQVAADQHTQFSLVLVRCDERVRANDKADCLQDGASARDISVYLALCVLYGLHIMLGGC